MQLQPDQAKFLCEMLIQQLESEHKTTLKVLRAVPDGKGDFRPDPVSMSAFDLAWHIASSEMFFMSGVVNGAFAAGEKPASMASPADVVSWYAEAFPQQLEAVKGLSGEQLLQLISFYSWQFSGLQYLNIMHVHSIHHRGQLSAYLRPMGAKVPSIYGTSADDAAVAAGN